MFVLLLDVVEAATWKMSAQELETGEGGMVGWWDSGSKVRVVVEGQ